MLRNPHHQFRIAKGSWEIALEVIDLCGLSGENELQWRFCKSILDDVSRDDAERISSGSEFTFGDRGDDWSVWMRLLLTCREMEEG